MGKQDIASASKDWRGLEAEGSGTSARVKRASREAEVETTKESLSGQGRGGQGMQQGPWDVPMEELTFQQDLERRMGFLMERDKERETKGIPAD